eukprot:CAMPEP_0118923668 /NCGR_PEP_ID=MMETSP1169-20130426/2107_1 /TAXON_ID=36882 /ORGANISM="Pyramimonas obovata, Strain CCMP722" /LENGTH=137 /DNA_ID=CAMNT_0006864685 /DNA_START=807 /DNA_END=1219 /DNA_ORIENTATION=+
MFEQAESATSRGSSFSFGKPKPKRAPAPAPASAPAPSPASASEAASASGRQTPSHQSNVDGDDLVIKVSKGFRVLLPPLRGSMYIDSTMHSQDMERDAVVYMRGDYTTSQRIERLQERYKCCFVVEASAETYGRAAA